MENEFKNGLDNIISGNTLTFANSAIYNSYRVNVDKIHSIEDVKLLFKMMDMHYTPYNTDDYKKMKHLLIVD